MGSVLIGMEVLLMLAVLSFSAYQIGYWRGCKDTKKKADQRMMYLRGP